MLLNDFRLADLVASDHAELLAMVDRCSARSREHRFMSCSPKAATDHVDTLFRDADSHTLVARHRFAGVIGVASLFYCGPRLAEVALLVEDRHQGVGVGRMLADGLNSVAVARGVTTLELTALAGNTRVLRLYRSARFNPAEAGTVAGRLSLAVALPAAA